MRSIFCALICCGVLTTALLADEPVGQLYGQVGLRRILRESQEERAFVLREPLPLRRLRQQLHCMRVKGHAPPSDRRDLYPDTCGRSRVQELYPRGTFLGQVQR